MNIEYAYTETITSSIYVKIDNDKKTFEIVHEELNILPARFLELDEFSDFLNNLKTNGYKQL